MNIKLLTESREDNIPPERRVEVDMNQYQIGESDKILITKGASTCIILAAHNSSTGMGLLGHFSDTPGRFSLSEDTLFKKALRDSLSLGDIESTRFYLCGAAFTPVVETGAVQEDRETAI